MPPRFISPGMTDTFPILSGDAIYSMLLKKIVTAQAEKRSVIKEEMTVGGKRADIWRADFHVNERLKNA